MSSPKPEESLTPLDTGDAKLDTAVVEQLVMAAVASLPPPTTAIPAVSEELPPTPIDNNNTTTTTTTPTTTTTTMDDVTTPELINFTDVQLQQINAVQAQAIAQAAASMVNNSGTDYSQLFANLNTASVALQPLTQNQQGYNKKKEPSTITQKVRQENRERKKRWRQQNQERNKDNDLRCRVNKRAHKLFGKEDSPHKQKWIDDEFAKRRTKRKEKEGRKLDPSSSNQHQQQSSNHMEDEEQLKTLLADPYISMLANNLHSFTTAAAAAAAAAADASTTLKDDDKTSEQFTTQLLEFLQQQQQNHDFAALNGEDTVMTNNVDVTTTPDQNVNALNQDVEMEEQNQEKEEEVKDEVMVTAVNLSQETSSPTDKKDNGNKESGNYPMDAVLTLMQLNAGWRQ